MTRTKTNTQNNTKHTQHTFRKKTLFCVSFGILIGFAAAYIKFISGVILQRSWLRRLKTLYLFLGQTYIASIE